MKGVVVMEAVGGGSRQWPRWLRRVLVMVAMGMMEEVASGARHVVGESGDGGSDGGGGVGCFGSCRGDKVNKPIYSK